MADTRNGPELHPMTEELATGPNFAAVSTMLPSLWVGVKDGSLV
jgi:hypothetical protein